MTEGVVRSIGSGRFLDWGAMGAQGSAGVYWDRSRQGSLSGAMRRFAQVVDDLALIDLPLQGGVYSWSGGRNNQTWARLDRFLVSQGWLDIFRGAVQCRLPRPTSDHFPILLKGGGMSRGPSPFRFENMWLKVEGFKELLREWWQGGERVGRASFRLAAKMKPFGKLSFGTGWKVAGTCQKGSGYKNEAKENFKKWVLLEEAHWRQMSRELWLREGDKNTGFFHKMASAHWRNNFLDRIIINGEELVEEQEVREGIVKAFQQQLREEPGWRADLGGLHLKSLDHSEAEALEEEILELFKELYDQKSFAKSLNATFLVIIPKKGGAEDLGEFRPISLLGGLYKLMAKVLANRLKLVLDKVVSVDQNAFRKEKGLVCKLDIEKAYDSISLELPYEGLEFFPSSKGLRQGDPISPYLFILGMEVLSALIRRAVQGNYISGCRLRGRGGEEIMVSHLLFADDTIIFCEASKDQLTHLGWILAWFEAASGLRINLAKSELIPVGEIDNVEEMAVD
ncbi:putative mitochondrial protein [Vitis vinifera]|uniref:Putative mitochondrial protein n=1 Tax=Vitis vinifera TaxID=29760 RepID=A0A438DEZ5_VITVI|nr:putative mitochondrial protein [Vitis vinifera]